MLVRAYTGYAYLRICIRVYAYWADVYYAYILVRIYLSCTVVEGSLLPSAVTSQIHDRHSYQREDTQ